LNKKSYRALSHSHVFINVTGYKLFDIGAFLLYILEFVIQHICTKN